MVPAPLYNPSSIMEVRFNVLKHIVTVTVAVILHPLLFVYVITLVPAETDVTNPDGLTVATPVVAETHGLITAGVPEPVNCVVEPRQKLSVPVMVGSALTVTLYTVGAAAVQLLPFV